MSESYIPITGGTKLAGRVAAAPKGVWDSATIYTRLDIVTHGHHCYMARQSSLNREPAGETDDYWMLLIEAFVEEFIGATEIADGKEGMVPKPLAGDQDKVLQGNGGWGPKLQIDIVKQNDKYGYINSNGEFVAFESRDDIISIIAEMLIPEEAQEALDTLEEIAEWIQTHPDDAAQMNEEIQNIKRDYLLKSGGIITGDLQINGELILDNPLSIESGGTEANSEKGARFNLNVPNADMIAPREDSNISSRKYEKGQQFIYDDKLCTAIKNIDIGDELIIGDNISTDNVLILEG